MTNKERFVRFGTTLASVGVAVGLVALFRYGVRQFILGDGPAASTVDTKSVDPDIQMVPRRLILSRMVPRSLRENIGGFSFDNNERVEPMPMELAERIAKNQAESDGWKPLDQPAASRLSQLVFSQYHYELPDGNLIIRKFDPVDESHTRVREVRIPRPDSNVIAVDQKLSEIVTMHSAEVRAQLPSLLAEVAVGDVIRTQLMNRGRGSAFFLTTHERVSPTDHKLMIKSAFDRAGWTFQPQLNNAYVKENLCASFHTDPGQDGSGSIAVYRFTDDEAVMGKGGAFL